MSIIQIPYPLHLKLADRRERLLWPSTAEVRFLRIMGCWVLPIPFLRHPKTRRRASWVVMRGVMKRERMSREVPARGYFIDFGNDIKRGIEIDGLAYHKDVIADWERDQHLKKDGWVILRIPADHLDRSPKRVRNKATNFLEH